MRKELLVASPTSHFESRREGRMALRSIRAFALLIGCAWLSLSIAARAAEPIRIGAVLPFSGGVELYGHAFLCGGGRAARARGECERYERDDGSDGLMGSGHGCLLGVADRDPAVDDEVRAGHE